MPSEFRPKQTIAKKRAVFTQQIRNFFTKKKLLEVETPIMVTIPGMEPHLTPFETELLIPKSRKKVFLNHSPELQMKKLLGAGFENIFTITKVFRNTEIFGNLHSPEFTMLEWYREKANYKNLMRDCENLLAHLVPSKKLIYQSKKIDLKTPWPRISTHKLFLKYCKIDLLKNRTLSQFKKTAKENHYDTNGCQNWNDIFFKIFLNHIEPKLSKVAAQHEHATTNRNPAATVRPLFIYDYPASQAALAKISPKNPFFAERFELYIAGIELANAFSELTNAKEQKIRLKDEQKLRKKLKKTVFDIDEEFLKSLESMHKQTAGIAMGIDRLMMLLLDKPSIEDVLLFPLGHMLK